jgi:hypothetical protein
MGEKDDTKALLEMALAALKQSNESNERLADIIGSQKRDDRPEHLTMGEMQARRLAEMRGIGIPDPPTEIVPGCTSILRTNGSKSGATFDARCVRGVVCQLLDYKLPEGHDKHLSFGGLVPNGMEMYQPQQISGDGDRQRTPRYDQWLYTFWREDLKMYVGHPLPAHSDPRATKAA